METSGGPPSPAFASTSSAPSRHRLDDLALEGLVGEEGQALVDAVLVADERLVLGHDRAHLLTDADQVVVAEVRTPGQLEVVVEAVLDHRADGVVGPRPQPQHRLGQHMGGRVAQDRTAGRRVGGDDRHHGALVQGRGQVDLGPVDRCRHRGLGQAGADRLGQPEGRSPRRQVLARAVGEPDLQFACHGGPFTVSSEPATRGSGPHGPVGGRASSPTGRSQGNAQEGGR